jgi:hypothetical protein
MLVRYRGFLWRCGRMVVQELVFSSDSVFIVEVIDPITALSTNVRFTIFWATDYVTRLSFQLRESKEKPLT